MKTTLKKALNSQYLSYYLWIIVSRVLPIVIIGLEYDLFQKETETTYKVGFVGGILLLWLALRFGADIRDFAKDMREGFFREFSLTIAKSSPYIFMFVVAYLASSMAEDFMFIATTLLVTHLLGSALRANHKRIRRKKLQKRGYVNVLRD